MWLFKLALIVAAGAIGIVALLYFTQTRMLFPTRLASLNQPTLPDSAIRLEVETPDGERLRGVHLPAAADSGGRQVVLLGFGGNAWNADSLATYLKGLVPTVGVVTFHYRGYRPSSGEPSAAGLLADAPMVYDHVAEMLGTERIVAVGVSIGSGVAAHLAAHRPLAGLILISPFDSLEALAGEHYPWLPVRWLLRHRMATADDLRNIAVPTAVIAAERDTIVPPRRTEAVRRAISTLVLDRTVADAGHNDLYERAEFQAAMVEAIERIAQASSGNSDDW